MNIFPVVGKKDSYTA